MMFVTPANSEYGNFIISVFKYIRQDGTYIWYHHHIPHRPACLLQADYWHTSVGWS